MISRNATKVQTITGFALAALLMISIFLPWFSLDVDLRSWMASFVSNHLEELAPEEGGDFLKSMDKDALAELIEDQMPSDMNPGEELRENGCNPRISMFRIMTKSLSGIVTDWGYQYVRANGGTFDEDDYEDIEKGMRRLEDNIVFQKISRYYGGLRLFLWGITILNLCVLGALAAVYFKKLHKIFALAGVWVINGLNLVYLIVIFGYVPTKINNEIGSLSDMLGDVGDSFSTLAQTTAKLVAGMLRGMLFKFHSVGFYYWFFVSILLLAWTVWCCLQKAAPSALAAVGRGVRSQAGVLRQTGGRQELLLDSAIADENIAPPGAANPMYGSGAAGGNIAPRNAANPMYGSGAAGGNIAPRNAANPMYGSGAVGGNTSHSISAIPMTGSGAADGAFVPPGTRQNAAAFQRTPGKLYGVAGALRGAEIALSGGELIAIGRDPSICQLILANKKVSRKHCTVQYNDRAGNYQIVCYSGNGMMLSGREGNVIRLAQGQSINASRGTRLLLAEGAEILLLS